jgi:DNA primase
MINWKTPVILCEGVFDAMAIKRNAIPILGKVVSKKLYEKLAHGETKDVYIALDRDALKGALLIADKLLALGKRVFLVNLEEKDPSLMGFESFTKLISQAEPLTFEKILTYKLTT